MLKDWDLIWNGMLKLLGFKLALMYNESNMLMTNPESDKDNGLMWYYTNSRMQ